MSLIGSVTLFRDLNRHFYQWDRHQVEEYQWSQVHKIIELVLAKSPFYREQYLHKSYETKEDFAKLPTIDKSVMMKEFDRINTVGLSKKDCLEYAVQKEIAKDYLGYYQDKYVIGLSSGTSGNKGLYITPKAMTKRLPALFLARGGIFLKDLPVRILFLLRVFSQGFDDINAPFIKLDYMSTMTPVSKIIKKTIDDKINILMAPPSLIRELLPRASELPKFKRIITYAEVLEKEEKHRFVSAFGTEVVEIYQASEGQIASPCKCGNLHINEDLVYVELFDEFGMVVSTPGKLATKMVVTNLINEAQPLLRYEMNDLIVLGEPCPCGSNFRRIDHIVGRNDDVFRLKNHLDEWVPVYPDLISRWIITSSDEIREFQATQTAEDTIRLILDAPESGETLESIRNRFSRELAVFGIQITLEIVFAPISKPEGNLKMKRFIRDLKS